MNLLSKIEFFNWVTSSTGIGECVFAIIVVLFIKQAEPIIRKIFGFDNAGSLGSALASGALLMNSMKTASRAIDNARSKKANNGKSGKNSSSKPQTSSNATRNQNNIINASNTSQSSSNQSSRNTSSGKSTQNGSNMNVPAGTSAHHVIPEKTGANNTGVSGKNAQDSKQQDSNSNNKDLNTNKKKKLTIGKGIEEIVKAEMRMTGMAMGAMASDDAITGAMTGFGYGTAFGEGAISGGKKIINSATRKKRLANKTNELINKYNEIQAKTGFNDELMFNYSNALLQISDLSKVTNPDLRDYGKVLHEYREHFEKKFEEPTDMVLDAINKIQSGELEATKESVKRYTRKK